MFESPAKKFNHNQYSRWVYFVEGRRWPLPAMEQCIICGRKMVIEPVDLTIEYYRCAQDLVNCAECRIEFDRLSRERRDFMAGIIVEDGLGI